ncbi:MAG: substrate-binding domain-containing protein, partial [Lachnospiraceae bacterium]|nr:substrate-binding domain-containing protein [Lachnospiraceae bacterium]
MRKKVLAAIMAVAMVALTACGGAAATAPAAGSGDSGAAPAAGGGGGKKVAVAMPTQSSERWMHDGANMKAQLEELGYTVDLQYAEDDVQAQVSQIENMIAAGANCLVIAAIDSDALVNVEQQAKDAGIPVI